MNAGPCRTLAFELVWIVLAASCAHAQKPPDDLTTLKLEDLMNLDVTSASKKAEKVSRVPSAIFVITEDDIQRSGATNIPDLLRMVPGLQVAQITPTIWAISARGFNGQYSNKLLVLIDGRAVYTPIYSGVYWDSQNVPLDLLARIEVIRGPGATVWGTNAVNGVINIITKRARDTQGASLNAHGGNVEQGGGDVVYGGHLGSHGAYRVFADGWAVGANVTRAKQNGEDDWYGFKGGLRADTDLTPKDLLTMEAEAERSNAGEIFSTSLQPPVNATRTLRDRFSDWHIIGRWQHTASPDSEASLQVYYDHNNRADSTFGLGLTTCDIDFQHHVPWRQRQDLVWGAGYRYYSDSTIAFSRTSFSTPKVNHSLFNVFLQDEIALRRKRLYLTLGAKVQHEYYNGFNLQPTARVAWTPSDRMTFWAAISDAKRTPARVETGFRVDLAAYPGPNNFFTVVSLFGNPEQKNERLTATEAGLRKDLSSRVSFDASAFFNQYHDLRSSEAGSPRLEADPAPLHLLIPTTFANLVYGDTQGFESFANLKLARRWTMSPAYSFITMHLHRQPASTDVTTIGHLEGSLPRQQAQLRSNVNLPWRLQWTTSAYFVGRLSAPVVPAYTRLDTKLAWQASDKLSLGVVGQNLQRDFHLEYDSGGLPVNPSLVRRGAYAWLMWRF